MRCLNTFGAIFGIVFGLLLANVDIVHASDGVTTKVAIIHATKAKGGVDKALSKKIVRSLGKTFGGYTTFKQLD